MEERALGFLDQRAGEILDFAKELIRTPSPNPPGDERAVVDVIAARLRALGIEGIEIHAAAPERPNMIVTVDGTTPGATLILSGHTDTKPAGDLAAWSTDPWEPVVAGEQLHGLGSGDMKVAIAAMVFAAAALAPLEFPGRLTLVLTADEEAGSALGSRWLAEHGLIEGDAAIIGEPGGIEREWEAIHVVSRGVALFRVKVGGTQMHSSLSDRVACTNASVQMARLMQRFDEQLRGRIRFEPHRLCPTGPTVNVGVTVGGGVYFGVYPGSAEFGCDVRTLPGMTEEQLIEDVQDLLDEAMRDDPALRAELEWITMMPASEIAPDAPAVDALRSATREVIGRDLPLDAFPGATDAAYLQLVAGVPTVASVGPGLLPRAHSPNEHLDVSGALLAAKVFALASLRFLSASAGHHARWRDRR